jgi:hypothetical protein
MVTSSPSQKADLNTPVVFLLEYSGTSVHERPCLRKNFPSKNVSDDERCLGLRTRKLRVSARECQLLVN